MFWFLQNADGTTVDGPTYLACGSPPNWHGQICSTSTSHLRRRGQTVDKYMSALSGSNGLKDYGP